MPDRPPIHHHVQHRHRGVARRYLDLRVAGASGIAALLAVLGPGVLAGLSDDDPAGVTTYSILGADFGYQLLWTIPLSTALLIIFHLLAVRLGIASGKEFAATLRRAYGPRWAHAAAVLFVLANTGTICAEFAGVAGVGTLAGIPPWVSVPVAAAVIIGLVIGASFHRIEHVLLTLSSLLGAYLVSSVLSHPDWGAVAKGLAMPSIPSGTAGAVAISAAIGTTLAPWGLAFIQSYAVDKGIPVEHFRAERIEVVFGSILTGVLGVFVAVACAATLNATGRHITDAHDVAVALKPLAGHFAGLLFGVGLLGAALLAGAIVTLPGVPLVRLIYLSQLVNAVFLAPHMIALVRMNGDPRIVGDRALGPVARTAGHVGVAVAITSMLLLTSTAITHR